MAVRWSGVLCFFFVVFLEKGGQTTTLAFLYTNGSSRPGWTIGSDADMAFSPVAIIISAARNHDPTPNHPTTGCDHRREVRPRRLLIAPGSVVPAAAVISRPAASGRRRPRGRSTRRLTPTALVNAIADDRVGGRRGVGRRGSSPWPSSP